MAVEGLSNQRHVVLPADGCAEVDADAADDGAYCAEGGWGALSPYQAFGAGLSGALVLERKRGSKRGN